MRNVKVTYILRENNLEKTYEFQNTIRITEDLISKKLNIEIDDSNNVNDSEILSEISDSIITSIILLDETGQDESKFTSYNKVRKMTKQYYDANNAIGEQDNKLRLVFFNEIINN